MFRDGYRSVMEMLGWNQVDSDDTITLVHCDPCLSQNKRKSAEYYCVDCAENFCDKCSSAHRSFKLSISHQILPRNEMPQQKLMSTQEKFCSIHRDKVIQYYCKTHRNLLCSVCMAVEHEHCSYEYIDGIAPDYDQSAEYRSLTEKISRLLQQLDNIKMGSTRNAQDVQTVYRQFVSDVKTFRSEINNLLDSMETSILKEAQEFNMKTVQQTSAALDSMTADVKEISSKLKNYAKIKQQQLLVISAKRAETKIRQYENELANLSSQDKVRKYKFHKNEEVLDSLKSLNSLGTLQERGKVEKSEVKKRERNDFKLLFKEDPKFVRANYVGQIDIRHSEDKQDCKIVGSVFINPNKIALTDKSNYSVKLVDVKGKSISSSLKLSTQPRDITCIDNSQLVITSLNRLVFVQVGQTLTFKKEIRNNESYTGIIFHQGQLFVSSAPPEPAVKVISLHGETLQIFSTNQDGQPLFKNPRYICMNKSKSKLFVSDVDTHTVTSLDLVGKVQNVYKDTKLKFPCGLTVDGQGNIYIAGRNSNNIHQISTQCRSIQVLQDQTHGMESPRSLTYCKTDHKLYISHDTKQKCNVLSVYQL